MKKKSSLIYYFILLYYKESMNKLTPEDFHGIQRPIPSDAEHTQILAKMKEAKKIKEEKDATNWAKEQEKVKKKKQREKEASDRHGVYSEGSKVILSDGSEKILPGNIYVGDRYQGQMVVKVVGNKIIDGGGKRRTKRRSNKKQTKSKRKRNNKTKMKRRKTHKRKTNKRRRNR